MVAAGDVPTITDILRPQAEQWAGERGFLFTSVASRAGWSKLLRSKGYDIHQVYIRKEL